MATSVANYKGFWIIHEADSYFFHDFEFILDIFKMVNIFLNICI